MTSDFSRIMTLLRKERKISQKKAAEDLGVSQGLLSHYEKGKRECGLDFLVRAADYYGVSCDYLLGRSPEPGGQTISFEDIPEDDTNQRDRVTPGSVMIAFNKKLINNSMSVFFSLLTRCRSQTVIKESSGYLMLAVYKVFRHLYSASPKNDQNFFSVDKDLSQSGADAAMSLCDARLKAAVNGNAIPPEDAVDEFDETELEVNTQTLAEQFPKLYSSMVNLIKNSEGRIKKICDE